MSVRAVFFDVDFTLIFPGPTFRGEGYRTFCHRYDIGVDESRFDRAVAAAAPLLEAPGDVYDAEVFVRYTSRIIEGMGGGGPRLEACAREIYDEWAACHHFELYEDVPAVLKDLAAEGVRVGLISNSHRCLASFQSHFELEGLIAGAISSPEHGLMKPNPGIFQAAMRLVDARPDESVMVGDSLKQDIEGALGAGMGALLLYRGDREHPDEGELAERGIGMIRSLRELPGALGAFRRRA
jgi:HAD superfamily hydrolase (TIGR01549 family)